jgi:hypothetical protein
MSARLAVGNARMQVGAILHLIYSTERSGRFTLIGGSMGDLAKLNIRMLPTLRESPGPAALARIASSPFIVLLSWCGILV